MVWWVVMQVLSTLIEWIRIGRLSEQEKDLESLVLCKQFAIVERQLDKPVRLSRVERLTLGVCSEGWKKVILMVHNSSHD
jgi:hypothetical protein